MLEIEGFEGVTDPELEEEMEVEEEEFGLRFDLSLSPKRGLGGKVDLRVGEGTDGGVLAPSPREDEAAIETLLSDVVLLTARAIGGSGCM